MSTKVVRRKKIHLGIRKKIKGSALKPRISIFRSNTNIYAQAIDDINGITLVSSSVKDVKAKGSSSETAKLVGKDLGAKLSKAKIDTAVFDRSGYLYHGRVKALAEGIREAGLKF